jgi:hypothetical protein
MNIEEGHKTVNQKKKKFYIIDYEPVIKIQNGNLRYELLFREEIVANGELNIDSVQENSVDEHYFSSLSSDLTNLSIEASTT